MKKYDIAAYIWPAYTGDEPRTLMFWPEGIGEWQSVKNAEANSAQYKPEWYETWKDRKPLWGYVNEADPDVMQMQIECAAKHGVNVFIYDWYWYDDRPFLENCLNDGYLKAPNNDKVKFYLMWSNHNVPHVSVGWDNNPRFHKYREGVATGNTPARFEQALRQAKEYVDSHDLPAPLVTVNSWNEWTETSYLIPDKLNGYGYLEAIKKVFLDEE